jgi:hypothetical protein
MFGADDFFLRPFFDAAGLATASSEVDDGSVEAVGDDAFFGIELF